MPIFSRVSSVYRNANAYVRKSGAYVPTYQVYVKGGGCMASTVEVFLDNRRMGIMLPDLWRRNTDQGSDL